MYSIFHCKSKKINRLEEGEPPPKKFQSEQDVLIKQMSKKQLETKITLQDQMHTVKQFEANEKFVPVTDCIYGMSDLSRFKKRIESAEEFAKLKKLNLSNEDAILCCDFKTMSKEDFDYKYRNVNSDVLTQKLDNFKGILNMMDAEFSDDSQNLIRSTSETTTLLQPMEEILNLEKEMTENSTNISHSKIRKKLRNLANKLKKLESPSENTGKIINFRYNSCSSLWDVKDVLQSEKVVKPINRDKCYSCKPQNFYTIKDNVIVKIPSDRLPCTVEKGEKQLSTEEIRKIDRFKDWVPGEPSNNIFLKNLPKNISERDLKDILIDFPEDSFSVRIMGGKMKGQAFVRFQSAEEARKALSALNGVIISNRPIICQFGKRRDDT